MRCVRPRLVAQSGCPVLPLGSCSLLREETGERGFCWRAVSCHSHLSPPLSIHDVVKAAAKKRERGEEGSGKEERGGERGGGAQTRASRSSSCSSSTASASFPQHTQKVHPPWKSATECGRPRIAVPISHQSLVIQILMLMLRRCVDLKSGKLVACPFCPMKKQDFCYNELLNHAIGVGAKHEVLANLLRTDHADAAGSLPARQAKAQITPRKRSADDPVGGFLLDSSELKTVSGLQVELSRKTATLITSFTNQIAAKSKQLLELDYEINLTLQKSPVLHYFALATSLCLLVYVLFCLLCRNAKCAFTDDKEKSVGREKEWHQKEI
ncbi:hypothetical protein ACQ4PT_030718 [Festuca glaucescens]